MYEAIFPFYVVGDRPADLAFELMADIPGDLSASFDRPLLENEALKAYATRVVRQRLHQRRFRYLVLHAYREQCAMCRLRHGLQGLHGVTIQVPRRGDQQPNRGFLAERFQRFLAA